MSKNKMKKCILSLALLFGCTYQYCNATQSESITISMLNSYSEAESANFQKKQKKKTRKQLTQELQKLQDEKKLQEQIEVVRQGATAMAGMLMKKITPATGTNPSCVFNKENIYVSENNYATTSCYVTLTWDAKTTRFSGNYQRCELSGYIEILDLDRFTEIIFYPETSNQAVTNCQAGSSWKNEEEFTLKVKKNNY